MQIKYKVVNCFWIFILLNGIVPSTGESIPLETWYKEEKGYGLIGCKLKDDFIAKQKVEKPHFCQITSATKKVFTISNMNGAATERYSTLGSRLNNYICQLEFKLPVLEEEMGVWMCRIGKMKGKYIHVKEPSKALNYTRYHKKRVILGTEIDIICRVPYSTENCKIKSPSGQIFQGHIDNFWMGECKTTIKNVEKQDLGNWKCIYSKPNVDLDDVITIEVIPFTQILSINEKMDVEENKPVELICEAASAIKYCRFVDPKGHSYHVSPNKNSTRLKYVGRGFEYGDCGIAIANATKDYAGVWTCSAIFEQSTKDIIEEVFSNITLVIAEFSSLNISTRSKTSAAEIGMYVGIAAGGALCIVMLAFIYHKVKTYRDRRSAMTHSSHTLESYVPVAGASVAEEGSTADTPL